MINHNKTPKFLQRFILNRKGTAEVIGSVLFIIILIFAFSNIYLWHDNAVKSMNTLLSDKLNSQIEVHWRLDENEGETSTLVVTNTGGVGTSLSRLWIVSGGQHEPHDLTGRYIGAGESAEIDVSASPISHAKVDGDTFTILTTLGNMASPRGQIIIVDNGGGGDGGEAPVGSIIVADFSTFNYYTVSQTNTLSPAANGYNINSNGANVAFSLQLKNNDDQQRTIVLNSKSQMFFINPGNPTKVSYLTFYIVNVANDQISNSYTNYELPYGSSTTIYFASEKDVTISGYDSRNLANTGQVTPDVYTLNLALLGNFKDTSVSVGQNIPFVTVYINN